jgi:hypothetical protein
MATLVGSALTGFSWTIAVVGVFGFFMKRTPVEAMQRGTVLYQQVISLGLFVGPLIGSTLADLGINLVTVLLIGAALRLIAGWLVMETRRSPHAEVLPAPAPVATGAVGD